MHQSKLIILLKSLSKKELKELGLFVSSPLFNKNNDVLNLLSILRKQHPTYDKHKINHGKITQALFKSTDVSRLRYVMTDLTKLLEQFLSMKEAQTNSQLHLVKALQKRNLGKYFKQELSSTQETLNQQPYRDEHYFKTTHDLSELSFQYTLEHDNRNIDTELQTLVDNLDLFYLIKKLKYSCEVMNRMNILNVSYDVQLLENLLAFLNEQQLEHSPVINTYYHVLKTLQDTEDESHYHRLKSLIKVHLTLFQRDDQYDLFGYLQNYCIKKVNSGNNNYLNELFDNYKEMITTEVVLKENRIDQFDFKNIVTVALRVEAYGWTSDFIENYQSYLPKEHLDNAITYNKARLYFHQKDYKKSRRELLSVEFTDIYYSLDSRSLLLKTYYEMEDFEAALSLVNAFKIYLKRDKKISEYQKATYSGMLKIANQLVRYKLGYTISKASIQKEVENASQIADSSWLKRQVSLLD